MDHLVPSTSYAPASQSRPDGVQPRTAKIRIKRPVTMPADYMTPDAALQSLRYEEKAQAKRQKVEGAKPRGPPRKSTLGTAHNGPPGPGQPRPPGRPPKGSQSDPGRDPKRPPSLPPDIPMAVDLATIMTIKDLRPRKWVRRWVEVQTMFGQGKLRQMRWVPEGPSQLPRLQARPLAAPPKINRAASGDGLASLSRDAKAIAASLAAEYSGPSRPGGAMGAAASASAGEQAKVVPCTHPGCKKMFPSVTSMRKHAHMHSEKTFACTHPGCTKAFVDASKLKRHMMVHSADKPFRCPVASCGKEFSLEFNLKTHIKAVHGGFAGAAPGTPASDYSVPGTDSPSFL